jgi:hypothetical protein
VNPFILHCFFARASKRLGKKRTKGCINYSAKAM